MKMKDELFPLDYFIGIEGGGTKYKIVAASDPENVLCRTTIPTTSPEETISKIISFLVPLLADNADRIRAIGLGQFGPIQVNPAAQDYGAILNTPKAGWCGVNLISELRKITSLPIALDTDVNAAAMGELHYGAGQGLSDFFYITIGTGIGGALILNKRIVHGLLHPELGHMLVPHNTGNDPFEGICRFHKDCFEGLASGPALLARWKKPAETLTEDHQAWDLESTYIAQALVNLFLTVMPQRFILGGGIMQQRHLFPRISRKFCQLINDYIDVLKIIPEMDQYIRPPHLDHDAGMFGAIALAKFGRA